MGIKKTVKRAGLRELNLNYEFDWKTNMYNFKRTPYKQLIRLLKKEGKGK